MKKLFLSLALLGLLAPQTAKAESYELSFAHMTSTLHPIHIFLEKKLGEIEQKSGGRLTFHIYDNGTLVKGDATIKAVRDGVTDMAFMACTYLPAEVPHWMSHEIPFLVSDVLKGTELTWEMREFPETIAELERYNAELLWVASSDRNAIGSIHGPIRSMSDLKGKRVIVTQPSLGEEVKAWGGIPVQVTLSDVYLGLQRGMGEAFYSPLPVFVSAKLHELLKHVTLMPSSMAAQCYVINKDVMAELPDELQKLLRNETGLSASRELARALRDSTDTDLKTMADAGVDIITLTPEELAPWKETSVKAMAPYWRDLLTRGGDPNPDAWMTKLRTLADKVEAR